MAVEIAVDPAGLVLPPQASFLDVAPQIVAAAPRAPVAIAVAP
ncbi:MAG: hypothetical protein ACXWP4_22355 [Polyangiales bacterium]